jgi:hypothetical protein
MSWRGEIDHEKEDKGFPPKNVCLSEGAVFSPSLLVTIEFEIIKTSGHPVKLYTSRRLSPPFLFTLRRLVNRQEFVALMTDHSALPPDDRTEIWEVTIVLRQQLLGPKSA